MRRLNHKRIFLDTVRLYFAPLTGAVRGCIREFRVVSRDIERHRRADLGSSEQRR